VTETRTTPADLSEVTNERYFGGKAVQLGEAIRAGLPVPPGFALPAPFVAAVGEGDAAAAAELARRYDALGLPVSVRSSGIGEDTQQTSFAGQHLTVLNVRSAQAVVDAVREVRESGRSEAVMMYRQHFGIEGDPEIGVVVQQLVMPETAGVMFTRHPLTGVDERVIDASWGLGEAVVGSLVTPDHYRLSRTGEVVERTPGRKDRLLRILDDGGTAEEAVPAARVRELCLDDDDLGRLHRLALSCEEVYGGAHDIEWAIEGATTFLLQRRPVTAVA
jgi:pyruvate,water dikinase